MDVSQFGDRLRWEDMTRRFETTASVSGFLYLLCSGLLRDVAKLIHSEARGDRLTAVVNGEFAPAKESSS